jgi:16S rRNA (guanine(527)-N(7))-methyltransferase GidB
MSVVTFLAQGLAADGLIALDEEQLTLCGRFAEMVVEKNKVMNLTGITDDFGMATVHFLDSLALRRCADFCGKRVLDIGSGAGFPGVPLAISAPEGEFVLLDALAKRIGFLQESVAALGLENVTAVHGRAEELAAKSDWRGSFDYVTSRAVAELNVLCELALPFLKVGGVFLAMKGVDSEGEMLRAERAVGLLGGRLVSPVDYQIAGTDVRHRIVVIEKVAETGAGYPRRFAKILKSPL